MPRTRNPYPTEFREQMVALVRTGRSVESLAREYEPCAATIHEWVRQANADDGDDPGGLTSAEREELRRLRREVKQLRQERDILSKAAAWFAQNDVTSRRSSSL
jgi:transposase